MSGAFVLELAEPPGLAAFGLQGTPPGANKPYRGFVESRGSGSAWFYTVLSEVTGKWEELFGVVTDGTPLDSLTRVVSFRSWNGSVLATNSPINWQPGDGTLKIFSSPIADIQELILADYRGTARPAWIQPGQRWRDSSGGPTSVVWKYWTGTLDTPLGTFNETAGTFSAAGNYVPIAGGVTVTGALTINGALTLNGTPSVNAAGRIHAPSMSVGGADFAPSHPIHTRGNLGGGEAGTVAIENQAANSFAIARFITGSRHWYAGTDNSSLFVITDNTASANRFRIDTAGNVILPGPLFASGGVADIAGLTGFTLYNNSGNTAIQADVNDALFYNRAGDYWAFFIGGSERARIDSTGFAGMPCKKFTASGINVASIQATGLNGASALLIFADVNTASGGTTNLTVRFLRNGDGAVMNTMTTDSVQSTWRLVLGGIATHAGPTHTLAFLGGSASGTETPSGDTTAVNQVQIVAATGNVTGNLHVLAIYS